MNEKEAQKVLDELQNVRPEVLNGEAKRLFEAIMKIADERDLYKKIINEIEKLVDTKPYVAYTLYGDILYESDEILEIIRNEDKKVGE